MPRKGARKPPKAKGKIPRFTPAEPPNPDKMPPVWCFHYLCAKHSMDGLDKRACKALLETLRARSSVNWDVLKGGHRHKHGFEKIQASQTRVSMPQHFAGQDYYTVFRYDGKLPMGGVRVGRVFHLVWLEHQYGDVYSHG